MSTVTPTMQLPGLSRQEAAALAATENRRVLDLVRSFDAEDWSRPTDCSEWDVRALVCHVLGAFEGFSSLPQLLHQAVAGQRAARGRPHIDGMTEVQVRDRAALTPEQLVERLAVAGPRAARSRSRVPGPVRRLSMREQLPDGTSERWRVDYLLDVVLTRDTWMHRVDLARATGRELLLTAEHDGRVVADVVTEWASRHGQPYALVLQGPAGGRFGQPEAAEEITIDAVEFCRVLSGRADGAGLLRHPVPF